MRESDAVSDTDSDDSARSDAWRGNNSPMPPPSAVSALRPPTIAFDRDFIPDECDPYCASSDSAAPR